MEMSSDFNFTMTSWFLGNVHVKTISTHSAPPPSFRKLLTALGCHKWLRLCAPIFLTYIFSGLGGVSALQMWDRNSRKTLVYSHVHISLDRAGKLHLRIHKVFIAFDNHIFIKRLWYIWVLCQNGLVYFSDKYLCDFYEKQSLFLVDM